jgi:hypothetical protein
MMVLDLGNVLCGNELCNMCEMLDSDNETMYYVSRCNMFGVDDALVYCLVILGKLASIGSLFYYD